MTTTRHATEQMSLERAWAALGRKEELAKTFIRRVQSKHPLEHGAMIADVGSGPGGFLVAYAKLGYQVTGVEPWAPAREVARGLATRANMRVEVVEGTAEQTNLPSSSFDLVMSNNVLEHVHDPKAVFHEAFRILKPGGVYWWSSASCLCPRQCEIDGFPLFGWYPHNLKLRIMRWAKENKPHLIGGTDTPAVHWWTPWKARRMLQAAGFHQVFDRWDIRLPTEGGRLQAVMLRIIQSCGAVRFLADIFFEGCAFMALKPIGEGDTQGPE